jgi:hypothetical protein
MPVILVLVCVWLVSAAAAGLSPARYHWAAAWVLIATGIPLLGLVTLAFGPVWGLIGLAAGVTILRGPILRGVPPERDQPGE